VPDFRAGRPRWTTGLDAVDILSCMHKVGAPFPALSEASRSVLVDLLVHGPASRADLARRSGLSPASLTRITRSFVDAGLVSESETTSTKRTGRPSQPPNRWT